MCISSRTDAGETSKPPYHILERKLKRVPETKDLAGDIDIPNLVDRSTYFLPIGAEGWRSEMTTSSPVTP
jgi:acetamidase/formamidase